MNNPQLAAALAAAKEGIGVIPVKAGAKHPPLTPRGFKDATTDEAVLRDWFGSRFVGANVALAAVEESGVFVVDLDSQQAVDDLARLEFTLGELPATRTVKTGGGYTHRYYRHPGGDLPNRTKHAGTAIDIKANGYVLAPPSVSEKGPYTLVSDAPVATAPAAFLDWIRHGDAPKKPPQPPPPIYRPPSDDAATLVNRARAYLAKMEPSVSGQKGHCRLFAAARQMRTGFGLTDDEAFPLLMEFNARCAPPWDEAQVRRKLAECDRQPSTMAHGQKANAERNGHMNGSANGYHPPGRNGTPATLPAETEFRARVVCLEDVEAEEVSWLWPDRIPRGRISVLNGRPGEGKTFVTTEIAAHVTTGARFPDGCYCEAGTVILLNGEDDAADTLKPRLTAAGADCAKVHVIEMAEAVDKDGKKIERVITLADIAMIEDVVQAHPDTALLVVDPIGSYLGGGTDAHRDNDVRAVLAPLAALAKKYNFAAVMVCHTRKSDATSADDIILGSRAFTGISRAVWHLIRDAEDKERRLLVPGKCNLAKPRDGLAFRIDGTPAAVVWEDGPVTMSADDALAALARKAAENRKANKRGPSAEKLAEAVDWLGDQLSGGPKTPRELEEAAEEAGISWRTVERAKTESCVESYRSGFGGGWLWRVKVEHLGGPPETPPETTSDAPRPPSFPQSENNLATWRSSEKQGENTLFELGGLGDAEILGGLGAETVTEVIGHAPAKPKRTRKSGKRGTQ